MSIPIIRLEVERMKHSMVAAMSEYKAQIDADLQAAVEAFCSPENLRAVIADATNRELKRAIEEAVTHFFRSGAGREAVREAVLARLESSLEDRV